MTDAWPPSKKSAAGGSLRFASLTFPNEINTETRNHFLKAGLSRYLKRGRCTAASL
jgi:hypothetical protein